MLLCSSYSLSRCLFGDPRVVFYSDMGYSWGWALNGGCLLRLLLGGGGRVQGGGVPKIGRSPNHPLCSWITAQDNPERGAIKNRRECPNGGPWNEG